MIYEHLKIMAHSAIGNYVLPGLTSSLIGGNGQGLVRMFEASRATEEFIVPHSHRFDFVCLVLRGTVVNTVYTKASYGGDEFCEGRVVGAGLGRYEHLREDQPTVWGRNAAHYRQAEIYGMQAHEIHSISFSADAQVLFFEGPKVTETVTVLEPWALGKVVPTFKTEPWMFKHL